MLVEPNIQSGAGVGLVRQARDFQASHIELVGISLQISILEGAMLVAGGEGVIEVVIHSADRVECSLASSLRISNKSCK